MEPTDADERPEPVAIPHTELSSDALRGVIESFVLREGTDYGRHEVTLDSKIAEVQRQLERGEAELFWDPASESVQLIARRRLGRGREA